MDLYFKKKFEILSQKPSDINEHLPTLKKYAEECESILELGVRGCVSSWAFAYGLLNNNKTNKKLYLNDLIECNILELLYVSQHKNLNLTVKYEWKNDLELDFNENFDLIFIDTWHVYGQLKRELNKFSKISNKYLILHDTTVDEFQGETVRMKMNAEQQSKESGFPVDEINCGLWKAVEEFLENNKDWKLHERFTNNNGLTILKKI